MMGRCRKRVLASINNFNTKLVLTIKLVLILIMFPRPGL